MSLKERKEVGLRSRYAQFINWATPVLGMSLSLFSGEGGVWGWYFWEFVADLSGKRCLYGMAVQRRYKRVAGICRRVRGCMGVQRRYKGVAGICRRVRGYRKNKDDTRE